MSKDITSKEINENYDNFWKEIVENPDGTLNLEQIKKELCDYSNIMDIVSKVYDHITGGRISNILTLPYEVIREADDHYSNCE